METNAQQVTTAKAEKAARKSAQQARIDAATLAARTFSADRVSLFDTARVTGAALKTALHSMVARTLATTPGINPRSEVKVVFGIGACVRHEWLRQQSNAVQGRMVKAVIMLPDFEDDATVPRSFADEMTAYTLHELAHVLFTNPQDFSNGILNLARMHGIAQDAAKGIINALEDVRIEAALLASGYAAGFRGVIRGLLGRTVSEAKAKGCMEAFAAGDRTAWGFAFAFAGRGYAPGAEAFVPALLPAHRALYERMLKAVRAVKADDRATARIVALADEALGELKFDAAQPGQPGGDQPQPGDGQPGEQGEPGPQGEPGEGAGEGAEPGENGAQEGAGGADGSEEGEGAGEGAGEAGEGEEGEGAQPGAGEAGEPGEGGAQEGEAEGGEATGNAVAGNTVAGGDASGATKEGTGKDQPAPQPGTFRDTEIKPQAVPTSCAPSGATTVFPPRVIVQTVDDALKTQGAANIAEAAHAFRKAGVLQANLRRLFSHTDRDAMESGLRTGRLRVNALPRVATGAENVFARRQTEEGINSAVSILIDGSGSMQSRAVLCNRAVALLVKALASCNGVRSEVQTFQEGGSNSTITGLISEAARTVGMPTRYSEVTLRVMKGFNDAPAHAYATLCNRIASGSTPDLEALTIVGKALAKRKEARKVLIVMVDGGSGRMEATAREVASLKRRGVTVIAIGIHYDPAGYEHAIAVYDINDLGGAAFRKVCEVIGKQEARTS